MTDREKVAQIVTLTAGELRGWYLAVFVWKVRAPKSGEIEAIRRRATVLGLDWKADS